MHLEFSPDLERELKKIKRKDSALAKRIEKQLMVFSNNPKHPSLRLHKLSGEVDGL